MKPLQTVLLPFQWQKGILCLCEVSESTNNPSHCTLAEWALEGAEVVLKEIETVSLERMDFLRVRIGATSTKVYL